MSLLVGPFFWDTVYIGPIGSLYAVTILANRQRCGARVSIASCRHLIRRDDRQDGNLLYSFPRTHAHTHTASDAVLFRGSLIDCRATLRHCSCSVDLTSSYMRDYARRKFFYSHKKFTPSASGGGAIAPPHGSATALEATFIQRAHISCTYKLHCFLGGCRLGIACFEAFLNTGIWD